MRISRVAIRNYRNLCGASLTLNNEINFLVGENDLGKSNFLDMLETLFGRRRRFSKDDFAHVGLTIEVEISLLLSDAEKGAFEDLFDPHDSHRINLVAKQDSPEEDISYFHKESGEEIHYTKLRCVNLVKYDSLRTPREELSFHRGRGVGRFLAFLVEKFIAENPDGDGPDFVNADMASRVVEYVNERLGRIGLVQELGIAACVQDDLADLVYRVLAVKDASGFDVDRTGYGTQFSMLVVLSILDNLMQLMEGRGREECIFTRDGDRTISFIVALDEPEIHLHPFMQRRLVRCVRDMLQNRDPSFKELIKDLFDIDTLYGQAILATHSPSVLLDDYRSIARFHREEAGIRIASGQELDLDATAHKNLLRTLPYVKEAFFSRCVIVVEGDTEVGALPLWAEKTVGDLNRFGISVVPAGGGTGIPNLCDMLQRFRIPSVGVVDRDIYQGLSDSFDDMPHLAVTAKRDFEEELVDTLVSSGKEAVLFEILVESAPNGLDTRVQKTRLIGIADKYGIGRAWEERDYRFEEIQGSTEGDLIKAMFLAWLDSAKGAILGRTIGEKVQAEDVPRVYRDAIREAKELTTSHRRADQ